MSIGTPKTPIRAITSTLVSRASPSVPPASQNYEPLVKSVLRYRLSRVFLQSAAICWATQSSWAIWQHGGLSEVGVYGILMTPLKPSALLGAALLWATASVPVIVLRKIYLTSQRMPATSPQTSLATAWAKSSTKPSFAAYFASSLAIAATHVFTAYWLETGARGDPRLSVFVKSRKHPHYLNGRFILLLLSQLAVSGSFLFRNILRDRFAFRWAPSGPPSVFVAIAIALIISLVSVTSSLPIACIAFGFVRMIVLPVLYALPGVHSLLRPFTAHFLRGPFTFSLPFLHIGLLARAWFLGFTSFFIWESAESLFDGLISEPVSVTSPGKNNLTLVVSGLTSADVIMKYFAYAELSEILQGKSSSAAAERQALFGDQKNSPNLWGTFVREALLLLGNDYQRVLRRGAPAPAAPSSTAAPASAKALVEGIEKRVHATPAPLLRRSIFKQSALGSPKEIVLDQLSSDGPLAQVVDLGAEAAHVPELFKSVSIAASQKAILKTEKIQDVASNAQSPTSFAKRIQLSLQGRLKHSFDTQAPPQLKEEVARFVHWWTDERVSRVVDASLPTRELDVVVIEVLTRLVCASLTEDKYGVVQRDIPKILEALLSFLAALEEYQVEIVKKYSPPPLLKPEPTGDGEQPPPPALSPKELEARRAIEAELEKATDILVYVSDGLKDGVARIVRTFGDKLTAFRFPPRTAQKLQGFMDFCP